MGSDTTRYILVDRERIRRVTKGDEHWFLTLGCGHRVACDVVVLSDDVCIDPVDPHLPACPNIDQLCQQEGCVREVLVRTDTDDNEPADVAFTDGKLYETTDMEEVIGKVVQEHGFSPDEAIRLIVSDGSEDSLPDIGDVVDELVDREGWTPGKIEGEDTDGAKP